MSSRKIPSELLTRREAILRVSAMLGGVALVGQGAMLAGCERQAPPPEAPPPDEGLFSDDELALLDEIAETILPETGTPGAKAAGVGPFMALMVTDCYYPDEQATFKEGLQAIERRSDDEFGTGFVSATQAERLALLESLDAEQVAAMRTREREAEMSDEPEQPGQRPVHYFRMMKELALLGYFTSEIGYKQAMRYAETPGRYDPCTPWEPGEKAWAPHA